MYSWKYTLIAFANKNNEGLNSSSFSGLSFFHFIIIPTNIVISKYSKTINSVEDVGTAIRLKLVFRGSAIKALFSLIVAFSFVDSFSGISSSQALS